MCPSICASSSPFLVLASGSLQRFSGLVQTLSSTQYFGPPFPSEKDGRGLMFKVEAIRISRGWRAGSPGNLRSCEMATRMEMFLVLSPFPVR